MQYLDHLVNSKAEQMKRRLLDLIDNIHKDELSTLETDLDQV